MANDKWAFVPANEEGQTYVRAWGDITADGTGTETDWTFASVNLPNAANTSYQVFLTAYGGSTLPPTVKAASKAATGFTITHDSGETEVVQYLVEGMIPDYD